MVVVFKIYNAAFLVKLGDPIVYAFNEDRENVCGWPCNSIVSQMVDPREVKRVEKSGGVIIDGHLNGLVPFTRALGLGFMKKTNIIGVS